MNNELIQTIVSVFVVLLGLGSGLLTAYISLIRRLDKMQHSIELVTKEHSLQLETHSKAIHEINQNIKDVHFDIKELHNKHDTLSKEFEYVKGNLRKNQND